MLKYECIWLHSMVCLSVETSADLKNINSELYPRKQRAGCDGCVQKYIGLEVVKPVENGVLDAVPALPFKYTCALPLVTANAVRTAGLPIV